MRPSPVGFGPASRQRRPVSSVFSTPWLAGFLDGPPEWVSPSARRASLRGVEGILIGRAPRPAGFSEAQGDELEESFRTGTMAFRLGGSRCRQCLLGGVLKMFFERSVVGVHFGWGNPSHHSFS